MHRQVAISIRELRKRLGPNQALNGASTEFGPRMLHGLIGPEGAGKTTLLRSLLGLLRPDSGTIAYHSAEATQLALAELRPEIAYMPQQQSLYPDLSIAEHLDFFRELYHIPDAIYQERREQLLHITRLAEFVERPAGQLSGGMYKKLGLMCALLQSPSVLLLDEPTNGVDPISRREFWELLYGLRAHGILIIFATAYMDEAERCDQVHLLQNGQFIASGDPRAVLESEKVANFDEIFIKKELST